MKMEAKGREWEEKPNFINMKVRSKISSMQLPKMTSKGSLLASKPTSWE